MPRPRNIVIDKWIEVFDLLEPHVSGTFWNFSDVQPELGSVYIVGRQNFLDNAAKFTSMAKSGQYIMIFCNAAEGSWTLESQIQQLRIADLIEDGRVLLIGGAEVDPRYPCVTIDHFLSRILDFPENVEAQDQTPLIFSRLSKPYKFLFLNGRARPHRKYLYEKLRRRDVLRHSLYTMLDAKPTLVRHFDFVEDDINIMATSSQLQRLPDYYEVERYREPRFGPITDRTYLKQELFRREWGEIYLEPRAYIDTYFSLVTETVCAESMYSFRTEKIAKPLAMGHPFIVASSPGFYRDLRNLGFRTFGHVIDEDFDSINDAQGRMDRIIDIVADLCGQDLGSFLSACEDVCKYNQQHLSVLTDQVRREFPERFFQFIDQHG